jgi:imidazolonepropionase-like amidohydrolase
LLKPTTTISARRIVVDTTSSLIRRTSRTALPGLDGSTIVQVEIENLKLLHASGVLLAIGSDDVTDTSLKEIEYLRQLNVFDNLTLLRLWAVMTPRAMFPNRKIASLEDGYEASFLALNGNPLEDFQNTRQISIRFKQGFVIGP